MRWFIPVLFLASALQATADNVTCSSGGISIIDAKSCTAGPITSVLFRNPPNVAENSFALAFAAEANFDPTVPGTGGISSASASFDDLFAIPTSPASDVFKIAILIQTDSEMNLSSVSPFAEVKVGPGAAGNPPLDFNSLDQLGNCHRLACSFEVAVPAFGLTVIDLAGSASLKKDTVATGGFAFSFSSVNVLRFASDGVTPDPFTPEPATGGATAGVLIAIVAAYSRRRRRTVAYS
ncbi:MAG TPA: hypothetical protein VH601_00560 [Bryobacteraceae bacterium]